MEMLAMTQQYMFSAFQVVPAGQMYEQEFLWLVASVESHSNHPIAQAVLNVSRKNSVPSKPVIGLREFPGKGIGGAVEVNKNVYRAMVIGTREFLKECGFELPQLLEAPVRQWEGENALVVFAGWDGWVRGVMKFQKTTGL